MHDAGCCSSPSTEELDVYRGIFRDLASLASTAYPRGLGPQGHGARADAEHAHERGVAAKVDRWVQPLSLTEGLAAWLTANGVDVREGTEVRAIRDGVVRRLRGGSRPTRR